MQAEDITLSRRGLKLGVFGDMGVGKTTLAMTFPRPLVIDTDNGLISVTYAAGGTVEGQRMEPGGYRDVEGIVRHVRANLDNHDTIVIDSVPTLCGLLIDELTAEHAKAVKHATRPLLMENIPEQIEYLGNQQQLKRLLLALEQTGKHIVLIGGLRFDDKNNDQRVFDLSAGARKIVGHYCDIVGELQVTTNREVFGDNEEHHVLFTAPKPIRQAKCRFADLRPTVTDPTYDTLWGPITNKMKGSA